MLTIQQDQTIVLDTGASKPMYAVVFQPNGRHLLGGDVYGIRRWRLSDGQEVARQTGMDVFAISVSRDRKWIACGTMTGASVWDGELHEKLIDVEGGNWVSAVDISPDSTRFATGTGDHKVSIWSTTTGMRLVGPLQHDDTVTGIRFSPNGEHIATAYYGGPVCVFDSRNGDALITIDTTTPESPVITPLAWSSDSRQIFAISYDKKIKSFDVSTGSQLAELDIPGDDYGVPGDDYRVYSLALAPNSKFIATFAGQSISFLDPSTLVQIGPVIEDSEGIQSIAISQDNSYLATGQVDGKIVIRDLRKILPDLYGPFDVSI